MSLKKKKVEINIKINFYFFQIKFTIEWGN